jgi:ribonuclease P protein component
MGGQSFPRKSRLLKPSEFQRVFDQAVVSSDKLFRVLARAAAGSQSRLGMAVSRKVDPRASRRNRIKRVIRESFRQHHSAASDANGQDTIQPARDYVVLAAPRSASAPNATLFDSLSFHWGEIDRKLNELGGATAETA